MSEALKVYDEFRKELTTLEEQEKAAEFDYESPTGNAAARSHIHSLRRVKGRIEAARKAEKQASLDYGRKVDAEAKALKDAIDGMIAVHQRPIEEIEAREKARQQRHEDAIQRMLEVSTPTNEEVSANELARRLHELQSMEIGPEWEEYMAEASKVHTQALDNLGQWLERQEKVEADRAELERRREEEAEQARKKREAEIAEQAARRARQEAEAAAQRAAEKHRREREEAEQRAAEAEKRAAQAEQDRKDAIEKEQRRREHEAAERRKHEEWVAQIDRQVLAALKRGGVDEVNAGQVLHLLKESKIPNVTINY